MGKAKRDGTEGTGASGGNGSMAATIDRELVSAALRKRQSGLQPSVREMAALRRWELARDEELRWKHYRSIPQKHWAKMSGRQWKILHEQAELYGISFAEAVIDLPTVVREIHDFFAKHFRKFATPADGTDELLAGCSKNIKDEYVKEQTRKVRLQADELEGSTVRLSEIHPLLVQQAAGVRRIGEHLQRRFGPEALAILEDGLVEVDRVVEQIGRMGEGTKAGRHEGIQGDSGK